MSTATLVVDVVTVTVVNGSETEPPASSDDEGVPEWLVAVVATLAFVALVGFILVMVFLSRKLKKIGERGLIHAEQDSDDDAIDRELLHGKYEAIPDVNGGAFKPLNKSSKEQLQVILATQLRNEAPASSLPGNSAAFPRGTGTSSFISIRRSELQSKLRLLHAGYTQVWYSSEGDILDELVRGLAHALKSINLLVILKEISTVLSSRTGLPGVHSLIELLYSQEGTDIDRLLLYKDAPVWVHGVGPSKSTWDSYHRYKRNKGIYNEIDDSCESAVQVNTLKANDLFKRWIKISAFLSELNHNENHHHSTGRGDSPIFRILRTDMRFHIAERSYVTWLCPLSCTLDYKAAREFMESPVTDSGGVSLPSSMQGELTLFRIYGAEYTTILEHSQYPVEQQVVVPALTPFLVESIRFDSNMSEKDVRVVDLRADRLSKYVNTSEFRTHVLNDVFAAEDRLQRIDENAEVTQGGHIPITENRIPLNNQKSFVTGCVRGGIIRDITSPAPADPAKHRCHECGELAHGMCKTLRKEYDTAKTLAKRRASRVATELWISGGTPMIAGCYSLTGGVWQKDNLRLRNIGHRWVVTDTYSERHAHLMCVNECSGSTMPIDIVRWARPDNGNWIEDPSIRVTLNPPTVAHTQQTDSSDSYTPPSLPISLPEADQIPLNEPPTTPAVSLPGIYGQHGSQRNFVSALSRHSSRASFSRVSPLAPP
eukprot:TRINITY_DN278_c1_g1_i1.p1 TRINITY_DN278_c1_g1~~TRINITY_DN278_c1_g1_i1.p1  ORF type:complete len:712 (+),score=89.78 TRINITY_DN278_c1_g1_i1:60-2195(+)